MTIFGGWFYTSTWNKQISIEIKILQQDM